jgi:hypothetical protein
MLLMCGGILNGIHGGVWVVHWPWDTLPLEHAVERDEIPAAPQQDLWASHRLTL